MSDKVRTAVDGRVFVITVDNVAKKNAFVPEMMTALGAALTAFDRDDELWVAVLCFAGENTTAGLDMPKFFGPNATRKRPRSWPGTPKWKGWICSNRVRS